MCAGAQAADVVPAQAQRLDARGMRLEVQLGCRDGFGVGGGQGCLGQFDGFGNEGIRRLRAAPLLPVLQPCALGVQGLAARAPGVVEGGAVQALERGIDRVQPLLELTHAAGSKRGLGLVEQIIEPSQCFRAGNVGQHGPGRRFNRGGGLGTDRVRRLEHGSVSFIISARGGLLRGLPRGQPNRLQRGRQGLVERGGGRYIGSGQPQQRCRFAAPRHVVAGCVDPGLQRGQGLPGLDNPAVHPMLCFAMRVHRGVDAVTHFSEGGALGGAQQARVERLPVAIQGHQLVCCRQRLAGQQGGGFDQRLRTGARLALCHRRHQPQLGGTVHPAVVAAQRALGLLERGFGLQGRHGRAPDVQQRSGLRDPPQRRVVSLRGFEPGGPFGPGGLGLLRFALALGWRNRSNGGNGSGGGHASAFLEEPAQHRMSGRVGGADKGRRTREPQCRGPSRCH